MKVVTFFLLSLFFFLPWNNFHDVQVAQFELSQNKQSLVLKIEVESKDIFRALTDLEDLPLYQQNAEINDYLQRTTQWFINDEPLAICNYTFLVVDGHFLIESRVKNTYSTIKHVFFVNEFLLDEIPDHMNIIHFRLKEQLRSFKMDKSRQKISLVYD